MAAHKLAVWSLAALVATEVVVQLRFTWGQRRRRRGAHPCRHGHPFADCPDCWRD